MQNILGILHYVVLALIVVCDAIIASVAVWNQSVSPESVSVYAIDICATCLALLGLVVSFTLLFLELAGKDSMTGKVWFECIWLSALSVVHLVVASAASAILVTQSCIPGFIDACTSTQTLLSFSWIITVVLSIYAIALFTAIYIAKGEHPDIWFTRVNQFPRYHPKCKLSSGPPTPVLPPVTIFPPPTLVAPVPRPFITFPTVDEPYEYDSGLEPECVTTQVHPAPRPIQRLPTLPDDNYRPAPSFYPQFIRTAWQSDPEAQQHQQPFSTHERQRSLARRIPSPPPLANWPRHDILSQPVKSKRTKNSVVLNTGPVANVSQHPLGPRRMPSSGEGRPTGEEVEP